MNNPPIISRSARTDLHAGRAYFESLRNGLGRSFVREVFTAVNSIQTMPSAFGTLDGEHRAIGTKRFGSVVCYKLNGDEVEIVANLHGGRSEDYVSSRLG